MGIGPERGPDEEASARISGIFTESGAGIGAEGITSPRKHTKKPPQVRRPCERLLEKAYEGACVRYVAEM